MSLETNKNLRRRSCAPKLVFVAILFSIGCTPAQPATPGTSRHIVVGHAPFASPDPPGPLASNIVPEPKELEAAMTRLLLALRNRDVEAFLALLSRTRPLCFVNTWVASPDTHGPCASILSLKGVGPIKFSSLAADLRRREDLYSLFDELRGWTGTDYTWEPIDETAYSPSLSPFAFVYVSWRFEETRWVVDVIAQPMA